MRYEILHTINCASAADAQETLKRLEGWTAIMRLPPDSLETTGSILEVPEGQLAHFEARHADDVYFGIQHSFAGADDWFASGSAHDADTLEGARQKLQRLKDAHADSSQAFDFRIVKKTVFEEVLA